MNEFGSRIRSLRQQKNMTLRSLAERTNLSYSFIASLEKGRYNASRESIHALAGPLEADVNELLMLAGFLPNQETSTTSSQVDSQSTTLFFDLDELLNMPVSYQGKELQRSEKIALLAFLDTLSGMTESK